MSNRCSNCNKFVGIELADVETGNLSADLNDELNVVVSGELELNLNCTECGTTLSQVTANVEEDAPFTHEKADDHVLDNVEFTAESTDRYDGKPGAPMRYRRHFYGAEVTASFTCSCGATAGHPFSVEEQAGAFEEC